MRKHCQYALFGYYYIMYANEFLIVGTVTLLAAMSPGPDFIVVMRNSLTYSLRTGVFTAVGIALGLAIHVLYSLIGIGFIIAQSIVLFTLTKYVGAAYLMYIGYQALTTKSQHATNEIRTKTDISGFKAIRIGFLTNVLNPKATIFFLGLFTQVIDPATPLRIQVLYGAEIMIVGGAWFVVLAFMVNRKHVRSLVARTQHRIEQVMGAALILLGVKLGLATTEQ